MNFQPGQFQMFKAVTKIHLGAINQDLVPGGIVEFDGATTRMNGQLYNIPSILGAIKVGWLVPLADNVSQYVPQPAGVQVRPATSASQERGAAMQVERAVDDERQVGSLGQANQRRADALANQFGVAPQQPPRQIFPVVRDTDGPTSSQARFTVSHEEVPVEIDYKIGQTKQAATFNPADIPVDDSQNEGARPVARLRPAKLGPIDISDPNKVRQELSALDPVMGSAPKIAKVAGSTAQNSAKSAEAARQARLSQVSRTNADAVGGTPIGQVHATGATGDVATAVTADDLEDLIYDAVSSGKPAPGPVQSSEAFTDGRVAWDKSLHWKARVKLAVEKYGNNPDALRQIFEVEDDSVIKFIKAALVKR